MNKAQHSLMTAPLGADIGERTPIGTIVASNESRFLSKNYSEALTAYTVGWKDPENLDALLEIVAPSVVVGRRFEFKKGENSEFFLSEEDDIRAIGSAFKRVDYAGTTVNEKTHNKGLTIHIDHDDMLGDDWKERYTGILMQRLTRNDLRRAIRGLVTAGGAGENYAWGDESNPDADLRKELRAGKNESGIRPNRILMGGAAWDFRAESYEAQNTPHAGRRADLTPEQVAGKLMVEKLTVSEAMYQEKANKKTDIVGAIAACYYARSGLAKDDPSNIKRFISNTLSGGQRRVYIEEHDKYTAITVEHYSNIVITSALGIRLLNITQPVGP